MSQKSAPVTAEQTLRQETLAFEKIPEQSKIFLDFQSNSAQVKDFYPEKNTSLNAYAEKVLTNYKIDRSVLGDVLNEINDALGAGGATFENIELLREKDCVAIVTGQQAGLFSGALYTIYKAFSAIKLAESLRKKNIKAVPVFWIAEEDHDFDEVKKTFNLDREGKLFASKNTPDNYMENVPVGLINLDETITGAIEDLFENLPHTQFSSAAEKTLKENYQAGESYSRAFGKFIARIFNRYGLIIVSPLDKNLKKLCAPIFAAAVAHSEEITSALLEKNQELEAAAYQPQVLVAADTFPFFYQNADGQRQPLRRDAETQKIKIRQSKTEFTITELTNIARESPQFLSPNALMRPVVQDFLLPTLVYFGGAAEIAYFAQNSAIYKTLNRPVTPIRHRASFTVIERRHQRTLEKYNLNFEDLFAGEEKIRTSVVEKYLNKNTAEVFSKVEAAINAELDCLSERLLIDEPPLATNLATRRKKINWHLNALRKKYHRAEMTKNEIVERQIESLLTALLPNKALQERTLNAMTFLNLYGENIIEWLYEAAENDETRHQILYL